jgi:hypothetical protein
MQALLLTAEQADLVRGPTASGELDPVQLSDGRWVLGVAVLSDDHSPHSDLLAALPRVDLAAP